ncbi:hypothetical protein O1611_g4435 [Lasiodiplodia mahajangana]|uniref:Uncharacterized protein n=1 Tax=Lasiodiplodia mahajangana TaxID=1108764 RepID=A0ACC2JPC0_9PEZI|nr:hypothetical protein O1611_g4435 [Lasiodiplodia mahajangana]
MADDVSLVLPPLLSPACNSTPPRIRIRHPGYKECRGENILLELPAIDYIVESSSQVRTSGLHHGTAIIACGIIANNAFDDVYFSHDPYGQTRVRIPRDNILEPGDYWLQLTGREPPPPTTCSPSPELISTPKDDKYYKYPIVPSFRDWQFPHGQLPDEWQRPHSPPQPALAKTYEVADRCFLTDLRIGLEKCHLIPSAQQEWFNENEMSLYCNISTDSTIDDEANMVSLMANIRVAFDNCSFVIVPKPSAADPRLYAFAAHILSTTPEARDFADLYQNVSIQTKYINALSPEFLFARFAWALFPYLQKFVFESTVSRNLAVIEKNEANPRNKWMNSRRYKKRRIARGESTPGLKDYNWEKNDRGRSRHRDMWSESNTDVDVDQ